MTLIGTNEARQMRALLIECASARGARQCRINKRLSLRGYSVTAR